MEDFFSIGEVSKITKIPSSTLRYYDKNEILSPAVKNENTKYRYYAGFQIPLLKIVNYMRRLGIPIEYIKSHFKTNDYKHTKKLIEKTIENTREEIERLITLEKELSNNLKSFEILEDIQSKLGTPFLEETTGMNGVIFSCTDNTFRGIVKKAAEINNKSSLENIRIEFKGIDSKGSIIGISSNISNNKSSILKKGKYACLYGKGWGTHQKDISKLLDWITEHKLKITGEYILFFSDLFYLFKEPADFLYTLKIPVEEEI